MCGAFTGFSVQPTSKLSTAAKRIELVVGAQAGEVGQTVRHPKESRDGRDVPNLVIAETVLAQHDAVSLTHLLSPLRDLHGKIKHGSLSRRDVRLPVITRDLIGDQGVFGANTQDRTVGNDAVLALVHRRGCDHNHLALSFAEPALFVHQGVVVGHERAELVGPVGEHQEDIGDEAGLLLHFENARADVLWHRIKRWHGVAADRGLGRLSHGAPSRETQARVISVDVVTSVNALPSPGYLLFSCPPSRAGPTADGTTAGPRLLPMLVCKLHNRHSKAVRRLKSN